MWSTERIQTAASMTTLCDVVKLNLLWDIQVEGHAGDGVGVGGAAVSNILCAVMNTMGGREVFKYCVKRIYRSHLIPRYCYLALLSNVCVCVCVCVCCLVQVWWVLLCSPQICRSSPLFLRLQE